MKNHNRRPNPEGPPHRRPKPEGPPQRYFFGWENIKWFIREFGKIYSGGSSYFSKKRVESGISFFIGQIGMIVFFVLSYQTLTMTDFIMWASLEFAVGGYITYQIQKQKRDYYGGGWDEYSEDDNGWNNNGHDRYRDRSRRNRDTNGNEEINGDQPPEAPGHTEYPS